MNLLLRVLALATVLLGSGATAVAGRVRRASRSAESHGGVWSAVEVDCIPQLQVMSPLPGGEEGFSPVAPE